MHPSSRAWSVSPAWITPAISLGCPRASPITTLPSPPGMRQGLELPPAPQGSRRLRPTRALLVAMQGGIRRLRRQWRQLCVVISAAGRMRSPWMLRRLASVPLAWSPDHRAKRHPVTLMTLLPSLPPPTGSTLTSGKWQMWCCKSLTKRVHGLSVQTL